MADEPSELPESDSPGEGVDQIQTSEASSEAQFGVSLKALLAIALMVGVLFGVFLSVVVARYYYEAKADESFEAGRKAGVDSLSPEIDELKSDLATLRTVAEQANGNMKEYERLNLLNTLYQRQVSELEKLVDLKDRRLAALEEEK